MATVTFSAAGETLYAYLVGEIDHDAAQSLRMQLDDALVSRSQIGRASCRERV